ncbi:uncharacterized protein [Panulirus ornatus]|uniref:uncharacterized protein n=1 Tax=Panulirus ornatus TaxID=150431 RepID=UPI003A8BD7EA
MSSTATNTKKRRRRRRRRAPLESRREVKFLFALAVVGLTSVVSSMGASLDAEEGESVKVFGLQEDIWEAPRDDVVIRYNLSQKFSPGESTEAEELTVCYRVQPSSLTAYEAYVSLALNNYTHDVLFLYRQGEHTSFYYNGVRQQGFQGFITEIRLGQWTHYCHVFSSGNYRAYVQGEERARGPISTSAIPLPLNCMLTLGQEQDQVSGAYDVGQVFQGLMTQVNIWNRTLSPKEIAEQASCTLSSLGNIFSTDRDDVELFGVRESLVRPEMFCEKEVEYVIFPERDYLQESALRCGRVGYKVYSPRTREDNEILHNASLMFTNTCLSNYHLWVGATDEAEEGVWTSFADGAIIQDPPFDLSEPNGGTQENCI